MAGQEINAYNAFNQYGRNQYNSAPFAYNQYAQSNPNTFAYANAQMQDTVAFGNTEAPVASAVAPAVVTEKKNNSKTWLIAGGIALAAAGLIFHKSIGKALGFGEEVVKGGETLAKDGEKAGETLVKEAEVAEKTGEEVVENVSANHAVPSVAGTHSESVFNRTDGTIGRIDGLDSNGKRLHSTFMQADGKTISSISKYDAQTEKLSEKIWYEADGQTVQNIMKNFKYDSKTGNVSEKIWYKADGKTVENVVRPKYDVKTGQSIEETWFMPDGQKIEYINKFDSKTGNDTETLWLHPDSQNLVKHYKYDANGENVVEKIFYKEDGKTIDHIEK